MMSLHPYQPQTLMQFELCAVSHVLAHTMCQLTAVSHFEASPVSHSEAAPLQVYK